MASPLTYIILGTGPAQLDAIVCAKKMGFEVHGLSYQAEGPGLPFVDHFEQINITDREGVLDYARSVRCDAIYSVGSDIAMPTVAYVAEELGLPCPVRPATAELLTNKAALRQCLTDQALNTLPFLEVSTVEHLTSWEIFPAIIKPVDAQGGRGVGLAHDADELALKYREAQAHSRCGNVIVEAYVDGPEFSINLFLQKGQVQASFLTDRLVDVQPPRSLVLGHQIPSRMKPEIQDQALALAKQVLKAVWLEDGPAYFQMKCQRGEVFLIEATPRLDGCHLWRLISEAGGPDLLEASLNLANGRRDEFSMPVPFTCKPLRLHFDVQQPGAAYSPQPKIAGAMYEASYYQPGEKIRQTHGRLEKVGYRIQATAPQDA